MQRFQFSLILLIKLKGMMPSKLLPLICFLAVTWWTQAELYNALTQKTNQLLDTQKTVIDDLQEYLKKETQRLTYLNTTLKRYKAEYKKISKNVTDYVANPVNAFTLIKRLTIDLQPVEKVVHEKIEFRKKSKNASLLYPSQKDLERAALALWRNQFVYGLNVTHLSGGYLHTRFGQDNKSVREYFSPMTSFDCFEVGRILSDKNIYKEALAWLLEAYRKYKIKDRINNIFSKYLIVKHICEAYVKLGDVKNALFWNNKLKNVRQPGKYNKSQIDAAKEFRQMKIDQLEALLRKEERFGENLTVLFEEPERLKFNLTQEVLLGCNKLYKRSKYLFRAMCRSEITISSEVTKRLKCFYLKTNHPFLRLAPIKTEQLYLAPDVYLFYNVLSDNEITAIKVISAEKFTPAAVNMQSNSTSASNRCVRMDVNLEDNMSSVLTKVKQRVAHFSGLNLNYSGMFQVVYYDVGGFKAPHHDFSPDKQYEHNGNHLSTILFYMSNAHQGGATVFLHLGLAVYPVKGAALYWKNLYPSGEKDVLTCHASCPVLQGSKWVLSRRINLVGQEGSFPCTLKQQSGRRKLYLPSLKKELFNNNYF